MIKQYRWFSQYKALYLLEFLGPGYGPNMESKPVFSIMVLSIALVV